MTVGIIRVSRGPYFFGINRKLLIYLDGAHVGDIRWRGTAEIPAPPGLHRLHVEMDWCRSEPVDINVGEGETVELAATIPTGQLQRLIGIFSHGGKFFRLERIKLFTRVA